MTWPRPYQDMQDVPDEVTGIQLNMDPRLRKVLEALDDDVYIDEQVEEAVIEPLIEIDVNEFEVTIDEDDDGWKLT